MHKHKYPMIHKKYVICLINKLIVYVILKENSSISNIVTKSSSL